MHDHQMGTEQINILKELMIKLTLLKLQYTHNRTYILQVNLS